MPYKKDNWLNLEMDNKLTWNHISELMHWNSPVVPFYKIDGISYNTIVNQLKPNSGYYTRQIKKEPYRILIQPCLLL